MTPKTLLEKTREFERQSKLADDKAKAALIQGTPAKIGATIKGPLFGPAPRQLTLTGRPAPGRPEGDRK